MLKYEIKDDSLDIIEVSNMETDVTFEIIREMKQEFNGNRAIWFWSNVLRLELDQFFENASSKTTHEFAIVLNDDAFKVWKLLCSDPLSLYNKEVSGIDDKCILFQLIQDFKLLNDATIINIIKK
jgi:hypothetical protein